MWGDAPEPAIELARSADIQYIGFDFLAELTMSMLHRLRQRDPSKGYATDLIPWMKELLPIARDRGIKLITNAGGANSKAAGEQVAAVGRTLGLKGIRVATIEDADMRARLEAIQATGWQFENLDTGERDLRSIQDKITAADVYTGADGIVAALRDGADVVVAGRVSDNALYVGPIMHELGWDFAEPYWDRISSAITAGHIIECSCGCTGGMSTQWQRVSEPWNMGYPIAEVDEMGNITITKLPGTGGLIDEWTVKEHIVYEILDPSRYFMPDGVADFTALKVRETGKDQVLVTGAKGRPRPDTLKMNIAYADGWIGEGLLLFPWPDAYERAQYAESILRGRLDKVGVRIDELEISYIGVNTLGGVTAPSPSAELNEVGLRVAARTRSEADADVVRRECTHVWLMGPVGTTFGVPFRTRPAYALWPTLVPRELVPSTMTITEV
jgi:hypothetical protein